MVSTWRRASGPPRRVSLRYTTMSPSYCIEFDPRFRSHIGCSVRTSSYALSVRAAWISGSVIRLRSGRALGLSLVAFGGEHPSTRARARPNRPIRGIDGLLVAIVGCGVLRPGAARSSPTACAQSRRPSSPGDTRNERMKRVRDGTATLRMKLASLPVTPSERHALLFFAAVALLGAGVRLRRAGDPGPGFQTALQRQIDAVDSARAQRVSRSSRSSRVSRQRAVDVPSITSTTSTTLTTSPVDLDTAPADSLERLPRIGPSLAKRIIADRDSLGPFGSLEGFQRVKGVGPAM